MFCNFGFVGVLHFICYLTVSIVLTGQEITPINIDGSKKAYQINDKILESYEDLSENFYKYEASANKYDQYRFYSKNAKTLGIIGGIAQASGVLLFVSDAGDCCTDQQQYGLVLLLVSLPLEITALTFYIISKAKKKKTISLYNELERKIIGQLDQYEINIKINNNGIGLTLNF